VAELAYLTPEARARIEIDRKLAAAGWVVQDAGAANLTASIGVAVREFVLAPGHGRADYLLFVDRNAVGALEAKKEGDTLTGVAWQTAKYVDGIPKDVPSALEGALGEFAEIAESLRERSLQQPPTTTAGSASL
jgi:type I restriction enzyme R subunit